MKTYDCYHLVMLGLHEYSELFDVMKAVNNIVQQSGSTNVFLRSVGTIHILCADVKDGVEWIL